MEKFALLNLLKAINGLSEAPQEQNIPPSTPAPSPPPAPAAERQKAELPNFMYETLMRHEAVSNRIHNKK